MRKKSFIKCIGVYSLVNCDFFLKKIGNLFKFGIMNRSNTQIMYGLFSIYL